MATVSQEWWLTLFPLVIPFMISPFKLLYEGGTVMIPIFQWRISNMPTEVTLVTRGEPEPSSQLFNACSQAKCHMPPLYRHEGWRPLEWQNRRCGRASSLPSSSWHRFKYVTGHIIISIYSDWYYMCIFLQILIICYVEDSEYWTKAWIFFF